MALTYAIYVDADVGDVDAVVRRALGAWDVDDPAPGWRVLASGLRFRVDKCAEGEWTVAEEAGVKPRAVARFVLNKRPDSDDGGAERHADPNDQQLDVLRVGLRLAAEVPGDEVLLFNGETVWLRRRQGQLALNSELWDARRLAIVDSPHKLQFIPSL